MLGNLYSSFLAHIENITKMLDKLSSEHRDTSNFLDQQETYLQRMRQATRKVGRGTNIN